ncbi:hypothetical protein PHLGIDRAFT_355000 [Phlebiopsis gigantea 11061_1 CR5-6]|uniref:Uncharacterized protein n=1 Tax=Phlebiopsis gigantea (strain 11061_1 CR5-6) TaxID=745531 RepID=A0A0C3SA74_PHLG1|nr:hypothetical protein PHLGIDRAFT_355000 [Phlebiopsis gigantea 11061_1 CR5-6]
MELIRDFSLNEKDIEEVEAVILGTCKDLKSTIRREWQNVRKGLHTPLKTTTSSKDALSRTPSKPSTQRTIAKGAIPQTRTPVHKAKVMFESKSTRTRDEEPMQVDETLSKKRKTSPRKAKDEADRNTYSAFQAALTTPSQANPALTSTLQASSSKLTVDLLESRSEIDDHAGQSDYHSDGHIEVMPPMTDNEPSDVEMGDPAESSDSLVLTVATTHRRSSRASHPAARDATHTPTTRDLKAPKATATRSDEDVLPRKAAMTRIREDYDDEVPRERRNRSTLFCQRQWFMGDIRVEAEWQAREERMKEWVESRGGRVPLVLRGSKV